MKLDAHVLNTNSYSNAEHYRVYELKETGKPYTKITCSSPFLMDTLQGGFEENAIIELNGKPGTLKTLLSYDLIANRTDYLLHENKYALFIDFRDCFSPEIAYQNGVNLDTVTVLKASTFKDPYEIIDELECIFDNVTDIGLLVFDGFETFFNELFEYEKMHKDPNKARTTLFWFIESIKQFNHTNWCPVVYSFTDYQYSTMRKAADYVLQISHETFLNTNFVKEPNPEFVEQQYASQYSISIVKAKVPIHFGVDPTITYVHGKGFDPWFDKILLYKKYGLFVQNGAWYTIVKQFNDYDNMKHDVWCYPDGAQIGVQGLRAMYEFLEEDHEIRDAVEELFLERSKKYYTKRPYFEAHTR